VNPTHRALRDATAAAHDRVDAAFGGFDLTDRAGYRAFLQAHAEVVLPLEASLPGERVVDDWPERKRGALLREDLALLPKSVRPELVEGHLSAHDWPEGLPPFDELGANEIGEATIAGTLYVLEGSRLGGRFLARQLPFGFPRAYLDAHQRAGAWQALLERLDGLLKDPAALDAALVAADAAFAAFARSAHKWLEKG